MAVKSSILVAALVAEEDVEGVEPDLNEFKVVQVLDGSTCEIKATDVDLNALSTTFSKQGTLAGEAYWELKINAAGKGCELDESGNPNTPELHLLFLISGFASSNALIIKTTASTGTWAFGDTLKKGVTTVGTVVYVENNGDGNVKLYVKGAATTLAASDEVTNGTATATVQSVGKNFVYWLTSDTSLIKTASVRWYEDGIINVANAVRGTLEMEFPVSDFPKFNFTLQGLYNEPADLPLSNALPSALLPPRCVDIGLKVGSYSPAGVSSFKIMPGWDLQKRPDVNGSQGLTGFDHVDRKPNTNLNPFTETIATYNPYAYWTQGNKLPLIASFKGNGTANNIVTVIPAAQYQAPQKSANNKRQGYNQTLNMCGVKGDDEFFMFFGINPT